jgi:cytoskeleton protein RodZ
MTSIGETLKRERLRRGLELEEVAREIKVRSKLLEYIEADQFDRLPGGVFAKSFVKQYAGVLGLDAEELAAEVQRQIQPEPAPQSVAATAPPDPAPAWQSIGPERRSSPVAAAVLVVIVIVACSFAYQWWAARGTTASEPPQTATREEPVKPTPSPPVEQQPPAAAPSTTPAQPPDPAPATPPAQEPPPSDAPLQLTVTATESTWVSAHSDGKSMFAKTLAPEESRTVAATTGIRLLVGNAGGVAVTLNGKPLGPIGPKGQVRIVQITPSGVQIQEKKPVAAAPAPDIL